MPELFEGKTKCPAECYELGHMMRYQGVETWDDERVIETGEQYFCETCQSLWMMVQKSILLMPEADMG